METKTNARKAHKKILKCLSGITKEIPSIKRSDGPSVNILVCNVGLVTGCSREEIVQLFKEFGAIQNIYMLPGKSYCFVRFESVESSTNCVNSMNGVMKNIENVVKPLYLCFVDSIPELLDDGRYMDEWPEGLKVFEDFVNEDEEAELLKVPQWESESSDLKHRKVKHYGYTFLYETNNIDREHPLKDGFPPQLDYLIERFIEQKVVTFKPDQLTVNQYIPGQGIPPHVDTHSPFEDSIISLSLGSSSVMEFKHPDGKQLSVVLPRRSCLLMSGEARYLWTHGITPRKQDVINTPSGLTLRTRQVRTSFTFRKIRWTPCDCRFPTCCDSQSQDTKSALSENTADEIERTHVFEVYENIAPHFSDTRHKPWPQVLEFVQSLSTGSVLVDIGCGNGKYLGHKRDVFDIGCDRSRKLLQVCQSRNHHVFSADCRLVPLRDGIADACISIAVIHHLATEQRRLQAIENMSRLLVKGGRALIYVWAKEQQRGQQKSTYLLQQLPPKDGSRPKSDCGETGILPIHENRTNFRHSDVLVPWKLNPKTASLKDTPSQEMTYHRFYHVFTEGELESLCMRVPNMKVVRSYYDQGNWCVVIQKEQ